MRLPPPPPRYTPRFRPAGQSIGPGSTADRAAPYVMWGILLSIGAVSLWASSLGKQQTDKRRKLGCYPYGDRDCGSSWSTPL